MKLAEANGVVERDGITGESGFQIAATAKAFEILSSKLYSDIPRAIIRELSTNAHDAHVEAGKADQPFDVHLPNYLEPWLEIRDFGPGLSPEAVKSIYTVYFASTRSASNEFAGCLGLGSKSPFAYSDAFTVTSYVDGTAYIYSLFKNEKQQPSITLMSQGVTTEPNGVAIRIAIKQHDFSLFIEAANKVYRYFKVKPNVKGTPIDFTRPTPDMIGDGYEVRSISKYESSVLSVVMGQVCYKVSQINLHEYGFGSGSQIEIHMNIGDCATAASREELHMDAVTKTSIGNKLDKILADLRVRMKAEMDKMDTTLEKVCIQNTYCNLNDKLKNTIRLEGDKAGAYKLLGVETRLDRKGRRNLRIDNYATDFSDYTKAYDVIIVEDDSGQDELPLKLRAKFTHFLLTAFNQLKTGNRLRCFFTKIHDRVAFEQDFGKDAVKLSTLPDPPKAASIAGVTMERNKSCIRSIEIHDRWKNVDKFEEDEEHAVVLREGDKIVHEEVEYKVDFLHRMMSFCGIKTVYGIPTRVMKKYDGELRNIFEICKEKVEEKVAELTEYEVAALKQQYPRTANEGLIKKLAHLNDTCKDMHKFLTVDLPNRGEIASLAEFFGIKVVDKPNYCGTFYAKYPLISQLDHVYDSEVGKVAKELEVYIKAKGN